MRASIPPVILGTFCLCSAQCADLSETDSIASRDPLREGGGEKQHLTGDWAGRRTTLLDRGIHLQFGYIGEVFGNVSGGSRRGANYEGLGEMALEIDTRKLTGAWKGGRLRASSLWLHGRGPTGEFADDSLGASNIEGHDSIRLYELWLEQNLVDDAFSVRAGSLLADEEFAGTDYGGLLLNSAFGWPAFISGNVINTGPAFYVSALGARLRYSPNDNWYFQTGIFDGDSFDSPWGDPSVNESGTQWRLDSRQGAFVINELGLNWNTSQKDSGLPGTLKLGTWIHTADFVDNARATTRHSETFGAYFAAQQMLWRESDKGVEGFGAFFRIGGSPEDRSAFAFVLDTGLHYTGLIPGRAQDHLALGFIQADFSDTRRGYDPFVNHEQVIEFTYEFIARAWWTIQPDIQWIHNPGGNGGASHALLIGLRSSITF